MISFQGLFRGISRYRLYKLIDRAPKLLAPYFWLHLLDVSGTAISFRNPTSPHGRKRRFPSESIGHTVRLLTIEFILDASDIGKHLGVVSSVCFHLLGRLSQSWNGAACILTTRKTSTSCGISSTRKTTKIAPKPPRKLLERWPNATFQKAYGLLCFRTWK